MVKTQKLLTDFPKIWVLDDGTRVALRPMVQHDRDRLALFFKRIPIEDLRFLKDDVTDTGVIDQWCQTLNYDRVLPLVAEFNGRIIADASLHRRKAGWRRHLGGVRVVVDPEFRHRGLAQKLIEELTAIARKEGLDRLFAEIPVDDHAAIEVFQTQGFTQVARFDRNILDRAGKYHDLAVFQLELVERR
jgi:ribosomal protein S18 acetylase RimI-like enzyme